LLNIRFYNLNINVHFLDRYQRHIEYLLLKQSEYSISSVIELTSIKCVTFNSSNYSEIERHLRNQQFQTIVDSEVKLGDLREYLDIFEFTDQNGQRYIAAVYDSEELFQDPRLIYICQL
jgi:hypothetical protein